LQYNLSMRSSKKLLTLSAITFLTCSFTITALGQGTTRQNSAQERAADLRAQLSEVEARHAELQTRLQQIEENLKPENIADSLAGVGSTHPEEMREQRRRQLEIEKTGVKAQLEQLAVSQSRLETAIVQADAEAYRQSAGVPTAGPSQTASSQDSVIPASARRLRRTRRSKTKRQRRVIKSTSPKSRPRS
jgi:chromosome segregation ATPase